MMNDYQFGNFLYELRSEKGLSQAELGALLGVTNKAVSKWENGSAKPNTNLIPKIAEIFDVSVEELFAARRIEKDGELQKMKEQLGKQKKKYAILSSIYLSVLVILPLLLILFVSVVFGFEINDEILGPLGSVSFIALFIVCTVAFVIYKKNYRSLKMGDTVILQSFINRVKLLKKIARIVILVCILFMFFGWIVSLYYPQLIMESSKMQAAIGIVCSVISFLAIAAIGLLICAKSVMRFLGIRSDHRNANRKINFREMPLWYKICYIASCFFAINIFWISIASLNEPNLITARMIFSVLFVVSYFPILIFMVRINKKK